jgi:predicted RNA-binding protein with PUA-like domain
LAHSWIFQANPERFDIDRALESLEVIHWRVPQYASEIIPGDKVAIWRSGKQAGIIGIAQVVDWPRESSSPEDEQHFSQGGEPGATTRVMLRVFPCRLVTKDEVAAIPEFSGHQIIRAPMGTVFPVDEAQWAALASLLPAMPTVNAEPESWPTRFSWEQRTKSMTPMPGGVANYFETVAAILEHVVGERPERTELDIWVQRHFSVTPQRAAFVVRYLARAGLLSLSTSSSSLTPAGERWLLDRDEEFLFALVHGRIRFVGEFLDFLDAPRTTEEVLRHANESFAMNWTTSAQITRRRQFLASLGYVEADDSGGMRRTSKGSEALERIQLAPPVEARDAVPGAAAAPIQADPELLVAQPVSDDVRPVDVLIQNLKKTAHESTDPGAFEVAVRDAFAFLGFESVRLGGSGQTDVLLAAHLGETSYRVVVDAKTTGKEAVSDGQIDWTTIDDHKQKHSADHAAIVGPAFRQGRVTERATDGRSVALIDVERLSDVLRQHAAAPLDLAAYRNMFDPHESAEDVIEIGESLRRQFILAAEILRCTDDVQRDQGWTEVADYYWNLDAFAEQFDGERASRGEISEVCAMLSQPPLSLLRAEDNRYQSLGSRDTQIRRLRLLAQLLEAGAPEVRER